MSSTHDNIASSTGPEYADEKAVMASRSRKDSLTSRSSTGKEQEVEGVELEEKKIGFYEQYHLNHVVRAAILILFTG